MVNHSLQAFSPGDSHGQRSLVGYSLWGRKESDTTEHAHTHTHTHTPSKGQRKNNTFPRVNALRKGSSGRKKSKVKLKGIFKAALVSSFH